MNASVQPYAKAVPGRAPLQHALPGARRAHGRVKSLTKVSLYCSGASGIKDVALRRTWRFSFGAACDKAKTG